MAKSNELSVNVVGRRIAPKYEHQIGSPVGTWPVNEPNANGEHLATVIAAYMKEGTVALIAETPFGTTFETFLVNVRMR